MKQRISSDQLQELAPEQQEKLRGWWNVHRQEGDWYAYSKNEEMIVCDECRLEHGYDDNCYDEYLPLLSIGQLIQLLDPKEETIFTMMKYIASEPPIYQVCVNGTEYYGDTMRDCLFEAVKSIL